MNRVAEKRKRPAVLVEFRYLAERQELSQYRRHDHRDWWASRHVNDWLVRDEVLNRNGTGRIGIRTRQAAKRGAGTNCDYGCSAFDRTPQHVDVANACDC